MSARRGNVLWVTEEVPDREGGGGNIRQANLVIELSQHVDVDVLVAGRVVDPAVRAAARSITEVPPADAAPSRISALLALLLARRPLSVSAATPAIAALRPRLRALAPEHDLVVVNHGALFGLGPDVTGALCVLHPHNVASLSATQAAAVAGAWRSRLVWRAEARAHRRLEGRAMLHADLVLTCSTQDAAALFDGHRTPEPPPVVVAPNGVDLLRFRPTPLPGQRQVLFFGSLDYPPNVDGIIWFVDDIWPSVRREVPDAELSIVGRNPIEAVRLLSERPGVRVEPNVSDAASWYAATDVVVVPLRVGTGTRLKALEAMASGRPTVGTAVGMEGLLLDTATADPAAAIVLDDPGALANAVSRCLLDATLAERMAAAGRAHAEQHYGWPVIAAALGAQLTDLCHGAPREDR